MKKWFLSLLAILLSSSLAFADTRVPAKDVTVNTSTFGDNIPVNANTVQKALQAVNDATFGGTPAGSTGQFQYNNGGIFAGGNMLYTDGTNIGIGNASPTQKLDVTGTVKATTFSGSGSGLTSIPAAQLSGQVPLANGGTGLSSAADDATVVSNGTAFQATILPSCTDSGGNHLNYDATTNSFSCGTSSGGGSQVTGAFTQLTSCPADIVAYMAALPESTRVQFPAGCSYTLTTASTVEIPSGVWVDFANTLFNRTATAAAIITATTKDVTKPMYIGNVRCTGAFATSCISINQNAGTVGSENAFILRNIQFDFTPDASMTTVYGFVINDSGYVIDGVRGNILTSSATTSAWGIRTPMNSTAEADMSGSINDWNVRVDCQSYAPTFCRGLDVAYQNASAGGSLFNTYAKVSNFYSYAHSGGATGTGEACKVTNDSGHGTVNETWWSNGVCDGVSSDFRDGSGFGDPVIAHIDNVEFTNGKYSLKSTGTYTLKGSSGKTSNFWTISSSATTSIDSQSYIAPFIAYVVATNDRVYFPPSMQFNAALSITKSVHLIGSGTDGCTHIATYGGTNTQLFNVTADNVSIENFCLDLIGGWSGILVNGTGGTSLASVNLRNIKINKPTASGNSTGIIYNDAGGSIYNPVINIACASGTCLGISSTQASTLDAVSTLSVYSPNIIIPATTGVSKAFEFTDTGATFASTFNVYGGYYRTSKSTGSAYGIYASGPLITANQYGLMGAADTINTYAVNDAVINSNSSPFISPLTIGGSGISASGFSSFAGGINLPSGQEYASNGVQLNYTISAYAAGTVYSLTNASAAVTFGTTSPVITIDQPGTYRLNASAQLKYNAATFAAPQTATCLLYRTNNTAGALTNATRTVDLRILSAITDSAGLVAIPEIQYITTNYNDQIQLYCGMSAATGGGTVDVVSANVIAKLDY